MTGLTKRAFDRRILHVDLGPALRTGDTPSAVSGVTAAPLPFEPAGVSVPTVSDISLSGRTVSMLVSGGMTGTFYRLTIRFEVASAPVQTLEAVTTLRVD